MRASQTWSKHLSKYPSSRYLNYGWGFGSLLGLFMAVQVGTGVLLAMYYVPSAAHAFSNVVFIINDVNCGYVIKYLHLNGASGIFFLLYLHMFRALYYRSYIVLPKVWATGMVLFLLSIITAFLGYVLPWGQMSFWAATVITNLVTSVPVVGPKLIILIHGAFSVGGATLSRFFVLHYLLGILLLIFVIVHILILHSGSSSNPVVRTAATDKIQFYHYFAFKDLCGFLFACLVLVIAAFLFPNALNHPDNFNEANPLVTPTHIVPEWYFLPFYAILRSIPSKLFGVAAMIFAIVLLFALPVLVSYDSRFDNHFDDLLDWFFYSFVVVFTFLGYLGSMPAIAPYVFLSQLATAAYFGLFVFIIAGKLLIRAYVKQCQRIGRASLFE